jgi:hypothetical protein
MNHRQLKRIAENGDGLLTPRHRTLDPFRMRVCDDPSRKQSGMSKELIISSATEKGAGKVKQGIGKATGSKELRGSPKKPRARGKNFLAKHHLR